MLTDMIQVIPFDGDYQTIERIERDVWPDEFETAAEIAHEDSVRTGWWQAYLAVVDGERVGWAMAVEGTWAADPDVYGLEASVLNSHQGVGVGRALFDVVLADVESRGAKTLLAWLKESIDRPIRFVADRGFEMKMREAASEIDLTSFDPTSFQPAIDRSAEAGITITSMAELAAADPEADRRIWALRDPIRKDIPSATEMSQTPFDEWKQRLSGPAYRDDGYFLAVAPDGELVGWSNLMLSEGDPEKMYTNVTGVLREWRRNGIATALKVHALEWAKAQGAKRIEADNEEGNPMYQLNLALGFEPIPAWLTYRKELGS